MTVGELVSVFCTDIDESGHGVAELSGRTLRVQGVLPGERAEVRIDHLSQHGANAWGTLVRRIGEPAGDRSQPSCPPFGRCGGCVWQHLSYPAQLLWKTRRVRALLPEAEVKECRPSPRQTGYRNRGKYVVFDDAGRFVLGAYAPRGQEVVDTLECQTVEPAVAAMAQATYRIFCEQPGLLPFMRYVVVRGNRQGQTLIALVTRGACDRAIVMPAASALAAAGAHTVLQVRNDETSGTILTDQQAVLIGDGTLTEELCGVPVSIGASEFLQVNRDQADELYREVARQFKQRGVTRAADLYCGAGGFALALAQEGIPTLGIERDPSAALLARQAARAAGLSHLSFETSAAESVRLPSDIDGLVVNPPRKGLTEAALAEILRVRPAHLCYVSCEPKSFARDAERLLAAGYELPEIQPFDMMPGTSQVELVTIFARRTS